MDKAQEHGFVCKAKTNIYNSGRFCAYAARDYKGKKEGNILWQAFPDKNTGVDCAEYLNEDYSNSIIGLAISLGYVKEAEAAGNIDEP
jgi:hypothetical protein